MDHAERLRRRREQYRARTDRETSEERRQRLARRREYDMQRYSALSIDERLIYIKEEGVINHKLLRCNKHNILTLNNLHNQQTIPSFDDPSVIWKVSEYRNDLMSLTFNQCLLNNAGICAQCHGDKHLPKLYSAPISTSIFRPLYTATTTTPIKYHVVKAP